MTAVAAACRLRTKGLRCGGLALALALTSCSRSPDREHVESLFGVDARMATKAADSALRDRGRELFAQRLGERACADCHDPARDFQDGQVHGRNTPSLLDAARQTSFGWDGAETDLAAMVERELLERCRWGGEGPAAQPVGEAMSRKRVAEALAAYVASLRSRSVWDRYVEGDDVALSARAKDGLAAFLEVGCAACHGSRNLGGRSFHRLGAAVAYPSEDRGRALVTGSEADAHVFRAPMLRHAARTAPYLHDGSMASLRETVVLMARIELGRELSQDDADAITAFLREIGEDAREVR
jgi:cytochrome c peroxidase